MILISVAVRTLQRFAYGMTKIECGPWATRTGSLLLAHQEKNVHIDMDYLDKHNAGYFSAAEERNTLRQQALGDPDQCADLQGMLDQYFFLKKDLAVIQKEIEVKLASGSVFNPDKHVIEKEYGVE